MEDTFKVAYSFAKVIPWHNPTENDRLYIQVTELGQVIFFSSHRHRFRFFRGYVGTARGASLVHVDT